MDNTGAINNLHTPTGLDLYSLILSVLTKYQAFTPKGSEMFTGILSDLSNDKNNKTVISRQDILTFCLFYPIKL